MNNTKHFISVGILFFMLNGLSAQCTGVTEWATTCADAKEVEKPKSGSTPKCISTCVPTIDDGGVTNCDDRVQWFKVTTDTLASLMFVSISGVNGLIEVFQEACSGSHVGCRTFTSDDDVTFAVNVETTYFLAVSSEEEGIDFDLCLSTILREDRCATVELIPERLEHPNLPEIGPYFPGENVRFHCTVEFISDQIAEGNNCQWLQGLLPSIGAGWDLSTMEIKEQSPGVGWFWLPEGEVQYNVFSEKIGTQPNPRGGIELALGVDPIIGGDIMPEGWWYVSSGGGVICTNDGDPDGMWGFPAGCGSSTTIEFQIDLQVISSPIMEDFSNPDILKLEIFAIADGQTGCWSSTSCGDYSPGAFSANIDNPSAIHETSYGPISIYPNPVKNHLMISGSALSGSYELLSADGSIVKRGELLSTSVLDLADQAQGIYLLTIKDDLNNILAVERIIK